VAPALAPVASGILIALLPKCPACIALYLAALGGIGANFLPTGFVWPATWLFLALGLGLMLRSSLVTHKLGPIACALAGALVLVLGRWLDASLYVVIAGLVMLVIGSAWSVVNRPHHDHNRVHNRVRP
jgi:hypothetical protein